MNEIEAKRIAAVVSIIRPTWREGHVMTVRRHHLTARLRADLDTASKDVSIEEERENVG